jgi:TPR repeat protein
LLKRIAVFFPIFLLLLSSAAVAGPFEDGEAAYERDDYPAAMKLWQPLADKGEPAAETKIGWMYEAAMGVPLNYAEAIKWYRKAADQGYAEAEVNLGEMYRDGWGVTADAAAALALFREGAEQGEPAALTDLSQMYEKGEGVKQDYAEALFWLSLTQTTDLDPATMDYYAKHLTTEQITAVKQRVKDWKPRENKNLSGNAAVKNESGKDAADKPATDKPAAK